MNLCRVSLNEWEIVNPVRGSVLAGQSFDCDPASRELAERLTKSKQLVVTELARGVELRSTSFVGRVRLGETEITVHPKISGAPLLSLFRYAYGLRNLHLHRKAGYSVAHGSFQDLLIQQLGDEVQEILMRGLHRDYLSCSENLASPRGRIDFTRFLRQTHLGSCSLPCIHHPRSEDTLMNQLLLAGILLSTRLTTDPDLRARMHRLSKMLSSTVSEVKLDVLKLHEAYRSLDRRTTAYESSLKLIELLMDSAGVSLSDEYVRLNLRGFLFDMNRFFQELLSRFLHENLLNYEVQDERQLKGMFVYDPLKNPQKRKSLMPRPDFVIFKNSHLVAVLDAKYRDLWEKPLPPQMLYQLAIYALGHIQKERWAAIIYPTLNSQAVEQRITIQEAVNGNLQAHVDLRPLKLLFLNDLLQAENRPETRRLKVKYAFQLAFGLHENGAGS